ncbi:MAG: single-stranded DNA-binding protein [Deltaproteobacteria bacterium]|nr:single-stranded DNA-binding protein [Deltaproteobacteria bacterium]
MSGVNKVILVGRLGKDPEQRHTQFGHAMTLLSVATSERWGQEEKTEWHRVVMYEKVAEAANRFLKKGDMVYLEGKLVTRAWVDQKGVKRSNTDIVANVMEKLFSSKRESQGEYLTPPVSASEPAAPQSPPAPAKAPQPQAEAPAAKVEEPVAMEESEDALPALEDDYEDAGEANGDAPEHTAEVKADKEAAPKPKPETSSSQKKAAPAEKNASKGKADTTKGATASKNGARRGGGNQKEGTNHLATPDMLEGYADDQLPTDEDLPNDDEVPF